jgi:hypothetical protein
MAATARSRGASHSGGRAGPPCSLSGSALARRISRRCSPWRTSCGTAARRSTSSFRRRQRSRHAAGSAAAAVTSPPRQGEKKKEEAVSWRSSLWSAIRSDRVRAQVAGPAVPLKLADAARRGKPAAAAPAPEEAKKTAEDMAELLGAGPSYDEALAISEVKRPPEYIATQLDLRIPEVRTRARLVAHRSECRPMAGRAGGSVAGVGRAAATDLRAVDTGFRCGATR